MLIAGAPNEEIAGAFATLLSIMLYAFCGILAGPDTLPRFWIFMYRVRLTDLLDVYAFANRYNIGQSLHIPRLKLHVHHTRPSTRTLRQHRIPNLLHALKPVLRGIHGGVHCYCWWLPSRSPGYRRVQVLPDGQHGPVLATRARQLGYAMARLWPVVGVYCV
jgi:hypothetical protein